MLQRDIPASLCAHLLAVSGVCSRLCSGVLLRALQTDRNSVCGVWLNVGLVSSRDIHCEECFCDRRSLSTGMRYEQVAGSSQWITTGTIL